ncbi:MAG: hypothetical protein AAB421_02830 [Patescibacteria group bacterium]
MHDGMETEQREKIIESLNTLNKNVERQLSFQHILLTGLVYGLSFAIGSTIMASLAWEFIWDVSKEIPSLRTHVERVAPTR